MRHMKVFMLATFILTWMAGVSEAQQDTLRVPSGVATEIRQAMLYAESGDLVLVSENPDQYGVNQPYKPFTMLSGVRVQAASDQHPWIDGSDTVAVTVDWPTTAADSTTLDGFTIRGGTYSAASVRDEGKILNCTVENADAPWHYRGIYSSGSTTIENCTVMLDGSGGLYNGDYSGIYHTGGTPNITNCTVDVAGGGHYGILVDCPSATTGGEVSGCAIRIDEGKGLAAITGSFLVSDVSVSFTSSGYDNEGFSCGYTQGALRSMFTDCFASVPAGVGIFIYDDSVKVSNVTIDTVGTGIIAYNGVAPDTIRNCIVTHYHDGAEYAFENVITKYCIADGSNPYDSGAQGPGSVIEDPLYCDPENGAYTLRVDSYGNPENNGSGNEIGRYPVACVYGTLQRSAAFTEGGTLAFTKDLLVPDGLELTLGPASEIEVAAEDPDGAGVDEARVELVVEGALTLSGSSGNMVVFESAAETQDEGDWRGIILGDDGEADIDYATIRHAVTGVENYEGDGLSITNSLFEMNDTADIDFKRTQQTYGSILVEDNTLNVGGGVGIRYNCTRTTILIGIHDNTVNMNSESSKGIELHGWYPNGSLSGNSISGGTAGMGIEFEWDTKGDGWTLEGNHITNCQHGIYAHSSEAQAHNKLSPLFDGNTITGCSTGAAAESTGVLGVFKSNAIASNTYGVRARSGANPDLGDSTTVAGNNNFSNNSAYCIQNLNASGTLMAQENYFGDVDCQSPPVPSCFTGSVDVSKVLCTDPTSVSVAKVPAVGTILAMRALPNPMNSTGVVQFVLGNEARVNLRIFDIAGRLVRDFGESWLAVGDHTVKWDGRDRSGRLVGSGVYFVNLVADPGTSHTIKVLVAR